MKDRTATSLDVARLAGVGRSTVSHVLNGSPSVRLSDETRRKVHEAAAALGYRPNSAALMLRQGATRTVGLLVTNSHALCVDGYIPLLFAGIGQILQREGYHLLLESFEQESPAEPSDGESPNRYASLLESRRIDGLIILGPDPASDEVRALVESLFPVVLIGSIGSRKERSVFTRIDDALDDAVAHVASLGHRSIGCIPFSGAGFPASDARTSILRRCLKHHGLRLDDDAIEAADFSTESAHQAARALLARRPDLSAIFAGNDTIALGAIGGAAAQGFRVPEDLSIVGFDDLPFSAHMYPALSTIHQDAIAQGRLAAELLLECMNGSLKGGRKKQTPCHFVARQSTDKVRSG